MKPQRKNLLVRFFSSLKSNGARVTWQKTRERLLRRRTLRLQRARQDDFFPAVRRETEGCPRLMAFLLPPTNIVSGGLMSISDFVKRSKALEAVHGHRVVVSTAPGPWTIAELTEFQNDLKIMRFEQLVELAAGRRSLFLHVPEMCAEDLCRALEKDSAWLCALPERRLNILNQNIEVMPAPEVVLRLSGFFTAATQTCPHASYCTEDQSRLYRMPLHHLPADYPIAYESVPYEEKENLVAYSNDVHPMKGAVLKRLKALLPRYRFVEIEHLPFREYLHLISKAKWTLSFGEGWDGYFFQPYSSGSVGLCVFNEAFCPAFMKTLPTVFPDYDTLPERMERLIRERDGKEEYEALIRQVRSTLFPPSSGPPAPDALEAFYRGHYTVAFEEGRKEGAE